LIGALAKTWWLLALCGIIDAICAAMNLLMLNPDGSLSLRRFALPNAVWDMSVLALVAGACAITAGLWNSGSGNSWLLSLHGLALGAFGLIGVSPLVKGCCKTLAAVAPAGGAWASLGRHRLPLALGYRSGRQPWSRPRSRAPCPVVLGYPATEDQHLA